MKSSKFDRDEALSHVLREWKVEAPLPPRFQEGVWQRIERRETQAAGWRMILSQLISALARPILATSYLLVLLLAGILAGYIQARATSAHAESELSARYVQAIDPYQSKHN
jgi:hypothetical protein